MIGPRFKTAATLGLLAAVLPVNAAVTGAALLLRAARGAKPARTPERRRTVLVSGGKMTKALVLCRAFHAAGHRVVLVETARYRYTGHRFSNAVDAFHVVPDPTDPGYADALLDVVKRERVDVYVPVCSPLASFYDALAAETLAGHCEVIHADAETVRTVDDKYEFARHAAEHGLGVPDTHRVTSPEQVADFDWAAHPHEYVLKHLAYDPVNRLDLTPLPRPDPADTARFARSKTITPDDPWIVQEFVSGTEYCTHGTVRDGRLTVYACCRSSAFQINYEHVDMPQIEKWVRGFVEPLGATGQLSFDLMLAPDGPVLGIECNPRTHSAITMFYDQLPDLAAAYLGEREEQAPLTPSAASKPTYWLYHELWRLLTRSNRAARVRTILRGTDAMFSVDDPLPFLLVHHLQIPSLLLDALRTGRDWVKIDFNIGKLVMAGGD